MACRQALIEAEGDPRQAAELLRHQGLVAAERRANRVALQGVIETYIHAGGRIGAMIEVNCETDFVARTDEFKALAHELAMQVAAMAPAYIAAEEAPADSDVDPRQACLLLQPYIRDPGTSIGDLVQDVVAKTGENIRVRRFVRFELGS